MNEMDETDEISLKIIEERNREIEEISDELADLSEISLTLSTMLIEQGETLDKINMILEQCDQNVQIAEVTLHTIDNNMIFSKAKEALIIVGGLSAGALGFLAGPLVGIATILSGASISTGIVLASRFKK